MNAHEYEVLVAEICEEHFTDENAVVYRHQKYRGRSGQEHDIDVAVEFKRFDVRFIVLIECKWWNQRIGVQEVMVLSQRLEDIGAHKGIIITNKGFESGAFRFAQSKNIALKLLDERREPETSLPSHGGGIFELPVVLLALLIEKPIFAIILILFLLYLFLHR